MDYKFVNKYGDIFRFEDFVKRAFLSADNVQVKLDYKYIRSGFDSLVVSGNGNKKPFEIGLDYTVLTKDDYTSDLLMNYLYSFFMNDRPYYIIDCQTEKRTEINLDSIKEKHKDSLKKRFTTISLGFTQIGSCWETIGETKGSKLLNSGESIDIELMFYCDMTPINIYIQQLDNQANSKFKLQLTNKDINRIILINEIGFTQDKIIQIDSGSKDGLVKLLPDDVNIKRNVRFGSPFVLYKGNNKITYTSGNESSIQLSYTYKERTIV
jgi:hypothetical protein